MEVGVRQGSLLGPQLFIALTADNASSYTGDTMSWSATKARLKAATDALISMSNKLRLAINNDKTQYLVARGGKLSNGETALRVGDSMVQKQGTIDFLGWSVVAKLSPAPFLEKQLSALKIRLYMVQRLAAKVPPAILGPVARAMFLGKASYSAEHSFPVRLTNTDPTSLLLTKSKAEFGKKDVLSSLDLVFGSIQPWFHVKPSKK